LWTAFDTSVSSLPFWIPDSLSAFTIVGGVLLTLFASALVAVVPALKATRGVALELRRAAVGGGGLRFGAMWTALIVLQVAATLIFLAVTILTGDAVVRARAMPLGFPAEQYLTASVQMHRETALTETAEVPYTAAERAHFRNAFAALRDRLRGEPGVVGVTYARQLPGIYHDHSRVVAEGVQRPPKSGVGHVVQTARVDTEYFRVLLVPVIAGRNFSAADVPAGEPACTGCDRWSTHVVVNETFVRQVFGGGNVIGRRFRYECAGECDDNRRAVHEIIGVVRDVAMTDDPDLLDQGLGGVYHVFAPGDDYWSRLAVHVQGDPEAFEPRLRALAAAVDPSLRLVDVVSADYLAHATARWYALWLRVAIAVCGIVLLLSVAGTYAIVAFTVAARTREIGIRVALGGDARRIVLSIVSRSLSRVLFGILAAALVVLAIGLVSRGSAAESVALMGIVLFVPTTIMIAVCGIACTGPIRRALRVEPTEALRADT
jgi:hypothetical protein